MLFRELIELDKKARNGDKQAARKLDIAAQQLGYADYADLFEGHPSEPVYLQLKAMARSQNPVHRAVARLSGELTLGELEKKAKEILKEEKMKSARELPAVQSQARKRRGGKNSPVASGGNPGNG